MLRIPINYLGQWCLMGNLPLLQLVYNYLARLVEAKALNSLVKDLGEIQGL